jgi:hypothetical protein
MITSGAIAGQGTRPLKSLIDDAHQRVYLLVRDGVDVRELTGGRTLAHVDLPGWVWVNEKYSCPPDIAFTPERDLLVTSNVLPAVWRIERRSLTATRHELALDREGDRDIGFTRLRWSKELGVFVGTTDLGERWYVDPSLSTAHRVLSPPIERPARPCK